MGEDDASARTANLSHLRAACLELLLLAVLLDCFVGGQFPGGAVSSVGPDFFRISAYGYVQKLGSAINCEGTHPVQSSPRMDPDIDKNSQAGDSAGRAGSCTFLLEAGIEGSR